MNVEMKRLSISEKQPGQWVLDSMKRFGRHASIGVEVYSGIPYMAPGEAASGKVLLSSSSQRTKPHAAAPGTTPAGPAVARIAGSTSMRVK
jgi:hypothetical protein